MVATGDGSTMVQILTTAAPPAGKSARTAAAANRLAELSQARWRREAVARGVTVDSMVAVRWRWARFAPAAHHVLGLPRPRPGGGPPPLPGISPGPPDAPAPTDGLVDDLHDTLYARLPHGRLVLTGDPGSGKTAAMVMLLLAALEHRRNLPDDQRGDCPVPVWLTLGGWDAAHQPLLEWAAATMARDDTGPAGIGAHEAWELLATGRVALYLDGLDEMPAELRPMALQRLDREGVGLRIVLTSRGDEFWRAREGQRSLVPAAVVTLQPVEPAEAGSYLLTGHPDDPEVVRPWRALADRIRSAPDSPVAAALITPLTLSLVRTTYTGHQDPGELCERARFTDATAVRHHLLDRIFDTAYPDTGEREHARKWLGWIARNLDGDRDLRWWVIPSWIPLWQRRLATSIAVGAVVGAALGATLDLAGALAGGAAGVVRVGLMGGPSAEPRRWCPRPLGAAEYLRAAGLTLLGGLSVLVPFWYLLGPRVGVPAGIANGVLTGLVYLLTTVWSVPLSSGAPLTPDSSHAAVRRSHALGGLSVGAGFGLSNGLFLGLFYGLAFGDPSGTVAFGLAAGLTTGLATGLAIPLTTGLGVAQAFLFCTGHGRVRFLDLLRDAHERQVLRQVGALYQFRHADLQDRLAPAEGERAGHSHPNR